MPRLPLPAFHLLATGLAGVALLATGCGGGGSTASRTTTTARPILPPTTAPPPGQQQLEAIMVQAGDLPAGWTARPSNPSPYQAVDAKAFADCVGAPDTSADVAAAAYSPDFVHGANVVGSTASSFRSPADVQTDNAALSNPKASICFVQVGRARLAAALPHGSTVKTLTRKVTPGAGTGPANVVATATGTAVFTSNGHQFTVNDDTVFLAGPRVEVHIDFYNTGKPVPALVKAAVVNNVSVRLSASP